MIPVHGSALRTRIKESAPREFARMAGKLYSVSGLDTAAEGMERLRDQSEFILLAYPTADSSVAEIEAAWLQDISGTDMGDGFDYDGAESAVREYVKEHADAIAAELDSLAAMERRDCEERSKPYHSDAESFTFRLYVRDNHRESA